MVAKNCSTNDRVNIFDHTMPCPFCNKKNYGKDKQGYYCVCIRNSVSYEQ